MDERLPDPVYRSWFALGVSGVLGGFALVALYAGFGTPELFPVAAGAGFIAVLLYRYAADRMIDQVYEGIDGGTTGPSAGTTDRETASRATDGGTYDEWHWVGTDPDDPFWSTDEEDWEDPWDWQRTDPEDAGEGRWYRREDGTDHDRGRWWEERDFGEQGPEGGSDAGDGRDRQREDRTAAAYEILGLEPGAGPEAIRRAYRERAKETHPDHGGSVEAFLAVREAYEHLRTHVAED